jgi:hypothetical protein
LAGSTGAAFAVLPQARVELYPPIDTCWSMHVFDVEGNQFNVDGMPNSMLSIASNIDNLDF